MLVSGGMQSKTPEDKLDYVASCNLPTPWAVFQLHGFVKPDTGKEHLVLTLGDVSDGQPVLARVHSECLTGDGLFSQRCDCGAQLEAALQAIATEGRGALLYLRQHAPGIGPLDRQSPRPHPSPPPPPPP